MFWLFKLSRRQSMISTPFPLNLNLNGASKSDFIHLCQRTTKGTWFNDCSSYPWYPPMICNDTIETFQGVVLFWDVYKGSIWIWACPITLDDLQTFNLRSIESCLSIIVASDSQWIIVNHSKQSTFINYLLFNYLVLMYPPENWWLQDGSFPFKMLECTKICGKLRIGQNGIKSDIEWKLVCKCPTSVQIEFYSRRKSIQHLIPIPLLLPLFSFFNKHHLPSPKWTVPPLKMDGRGTLFVVFFWDLPYS